MIYYIHITQISKYILDSSSARKLCNCNVGQKQFFNFTKYISIINYLSRFFKFLQSKISKNLIILFF